MAEDLVKHLRNPNHAQAATLAESMMKQAADLIEQQAASLAELNHDTAAMADEIQRLETERAIQERRADQAERALAEAVEVMRAMVARHEPRISELDPDKYPKTIAEINAARAFIHQHQPEVSK